MIFGFFVALVWTIYVLYPNPAYFAKSVYRLYDPPINPCPEVIQYIAIKTAGETPLKVERFVKAFFPYQHDWETYNLPWYFPTVKEAIEKRTGDCKTRLIITASVFTAHELPYTLSISPTHVWVDYEGRAGGSNESRKVTMFNSERGFSAPKVNLRDSSRSFLDAFWHPMPIEKKQSLFSGFLFFPLLAFLPEKNLHYLF